MPPFMTIVESYNQEYLRPDFCSLHLHMPWKGNDHLSRDIVALWTVERAEGGETIPDEFELCEASSYQWLDEMGPTWDSLNLTGHVSWAHRSRVQATIARERGTEIFFLLNYILLGVCNRTGFNRKPDRTTRKIGPRTDSCSNRSEYKF